MKRKNRFKFLNVLILLTLFKHYALGSANNQIPEIPPDLTYRIPQILKLYNETLYTEGSKVGFEWETNNDGDPHASIKNGEKIVFITKGFLNNKSLSPDGRIMTLCHELGHHFGGAPKRNKHPLELINSRDSSPYSWSSVEGQADYYAAAKCAKIIFSLDKTSDQPQKKEVNPIVQQACDQAYNSEQDQRICYRVNLAALNLLTAYNTKNELFGYELHAEPLNTKGIVANHPDKQCRLETFLAGSLCQISPRLNPSSTDPNQNYCTNGLGQRPQCWYNL